MTILDAILLAAISALAALQLGASDWVGFAAGIVAFLIGIGCLGTLRPSHENQHRECPPTDVHFTSGAAANPA